MQLSLHRDSSLVRVPESEPGGWGSIPGGGMLVLKGALPGDRDDRLFSKNPPIKRANIPEIKTI